MEDYNPDYDFNNENNHHEDHREHGEQSHSEENHNDSENVTNDGEENQEGQENDTDNPELDELLESNDEESDPELDDSIETLAIAAEDDEELIEPISWFDIHAIIKFCARIVSAKENQVRAMGEIFYDISDTSDLKPLKLAEIVSEPSDRADVAEHVLGYLSDIRTTDVLEMQSVMNRYTQWAYSELEDSERKHVSRVLTTLCAEFPAKIEKKNEDGSTLYENGEPVYEEPYVPKKTNARTDGSEIIYLLNECSSKIDNEELESFVSWYRDLSEIWPGEFE